MIDEKRLIIVLEKNFGHTGAFSVLKKLIEEQPKINKWIPFAFDEEGMLDCKCPEVDEEILVSDDISVWTDIWVEYEGYGLDSNNELEGLAWQPLPKPYEDKENE